MTQEMRSEIKQVKKQHVGAIWTEIPLVLSMYLQLTWKYLLVGKKHWGEEVMRFPHLGKRGPTESMDPSPNRANPSCSELFDYKAELHEGRTRDCSFTR